MSWASCWHVVTTHITTCQHDTDAWLVKEMRGLLAPFISLLFNRSFTTGCFPLEFKEAIIRPRLKNSGREDSELKNYRPVSNLSFLSKLFEKTAQVRISLTATDWCQRCGPRTDITGQFPAPRSVSAPRPTTPRSAMRSAPLHRFSATPAHRSAPLHPTIKLRSRSCGPELTVGKLITRFIVKMCNDNNLFN